MGHTGKIRTIMSEDEASGKVCPFKMTWGEGKRGCAGSLCMVWRFSDYTHSGEVITDTFGYCGLGGKPNSCGLMLS